MEGNSRSFVKRVFRPAAYSIRQVVSGAIDRRLHIDTKGDIALAELDVDAKNRLAYAPSNWSALHRILRKNEVSEDDVFIDFGSGKGRVVYQAARSYPFKRVIGVELSEQLNAVARDNVERNRSRLRCQQVELVTSDVLEYEIPSDVTIAYFNDPFRGDIFAAVIDKLVASLDLHPRPLRLIYLNPAEEAYILQSGFNLIRTARGLRPGRKWSADTSARMYLAPPRGI